MKNMYTFTKSFSKMSVAMIACLSLSTIFSNIAEAKVNSKKADQFHMIINNHKIQLGDSLFDIEQQLGTAHDKSFDKETNSHSLHWWFDNGLTVVTIFKDAKSSKKNTRNYEQFKPRKKIRTKTDTHPVKPDVINLLGYSGQPTTVEKLDDGTSLVTMNKKVTIERFRPLKKRPLVNNHSKKLSEIIISSSAKQSDSYMIAYGEKVKLNKKSINQLEKKFNDAHRCLSYYEQGKLGWVDFTVRDGKGKDYHANFSSINNSKYSLTQSLGVQNTKKKLVDSLSLSKGLENHSVEIYCKDWYER